MNKKTIKIIIIASLFSFIGVFEQSSIPVILPQLSTILNIDISLANWISISYMLFCVALGLTFGKIVSKFGMIKIAKICTVFMIIGAIISTLILNTYALIFAKSIQGICTAGFFLISYLIVIRCVEEKNVGLTLGIVAAGSFLSLILAPIIGGYMANYIYPQLIFAFNIPLLILCLILLFTIKEEWKEDVKIDYIGTVIWIVSMVLFIYGVSFLSERTGLICFIISLIFIAIFVYYQLKIKHPLYDFRLLKNKTYAIDNYSSMMGIFIKDGLTFILPLYFVYSGILTPLEAGYFIGFLGIIMLISSPISGKLSDLMNSRKLVITGVTIMTISLFILSFRIFIPRLLFLIFLITLIIGFCIFETPNKKLVLESSNDSNLPDVSAFLSTIRDMGSLLPQAIYTLFIVIFSHVSLKVGYLEFTFLLMIVLFFAIGISMLLLNLKSLKKEKTLI